MLSQGNNILDLLPGLNPLAGQKSQATGNAAGVSDQSFPDVFDLLFAGEKLQTAGTNTSQASSLLDFASMLSGQVEDGETGIELSASNQKQATLEATVEELLGNSGNKTSQNAKAEFSLLFGMGDISEFGLSNGNVAATADEAKSDDVGTDEGKQATDAATLLQSQGMIAGQNVRDLLAAMPAELETGNYRIVDVRVTDKQVTLKVEPENDSGNLIKVTLPLDQVAELAGASNSPRVTDAASTMDQLTRVKLSESEKTDAVKVQKLLSQLNLKEFQIAKADVTQEETPEQQKVASDEVINVKITATRSGEEVAIKLNMKAAEMHAVKQSDATQVATTKSDDPSATDDLTSNEQISKEHSESDMVTNETPDSEIDFEQWIKGSRTNKLSDAGDSGISKSDQAHVSTFFDRASGTRTMPDQQTTLPPVRFSLPDNITAAMKTNSQSVMISIEPDNLGPAKLHLAMHNDALTARLTVDSIHAKAAVESSLDQLTDQLARAGVKVHHVEVSVSGGDVGSNLFERRPVWNAKGRSSTQSIDQLFESNTTTPTPTASYRSSGYVRADGVNVFA